MPRSIFLSLSLSMSMSLVACRDDVVDGPFEPLCDERGPVELLRLGDDEVVESVWRVDDDDLHVAISTSLEDGESSHRSVVVDRCGGERSELASDVFHLTRWDDALVGCVDGDLARFSDYDDPAPTVLARRGCGGRSIDDIFVTFDIEPEATVGRLVALEAVGSGVEVRVLVDEVIVGDHPLDIFQTVHDDRAFVQTTDLAMRSVDPRTGEVGLEVEEAEPSAWSAHADVIAYRAPVLDPDAPAPVLIRDRRTGTEQTLDAGIPASWWLGWAADGVLAAGPSSGLIHRWFFIDPLREVVAPEGMRIERVRGDGLVWLSQSSETSLDITFFRWREGEAPQPAWACTDCDRAPVQTSRERLDVLVRTPHEDRFELWQLDDLGGPPRLRANPVDHWYHPLDDDRVLSIVTGRDFEYGSLKLHDGSGGPAVTLAPRVHRHAIFMSYYGEPDEIFYEAVPHAPSEDDPHALYRARLAP